MQADYLGYKRKRINISVYVHFGEMIFFLSYFGHLPLIEVLNRTRGSIAQNPPSLNISNKSMRVKKIIKGNLTLKIV